MLRIALARLRNEGYVTSRRGSGNFVAPRGRETRTPLDFGQFSIRSITELSACLKFRLVIAVAASGDAALNAEDANLRRLDASIESFRRSLPEPGRFDHDLAFHLAVARASKNMFFLATIEGLVPSLRTGHELSRRLREVPLNEIDRVTTEHARVADAIRAGDAEAARRAMAAHLDAGLARLFGTGLETGRGVRGMSRAG